MVPRALLSLSILYNYMMSIEGSEPVVMLDSDGKPLIDEEYAHHSEE